MYLSELIKMDEKKLNKLSKAEIVEAIKSSKWQWESNENSVKKANLELVAQKSDENAAKLMMIGYLGEGFEVDEYSGKVDLDKVSLVETLGKIMVKAARY